MPCNKGKSFIFVFIIEKERKKLLIQISLEEMQAADMQQLVVMDTPIL